MKSSTFATIKNLKMRFSVYKKKKQRNKETKMSSHFTTQTLSRDIEWFNLQFESNRYSLSPWQRDDCWSPEYQKTLIKSILLGIDIPKIYIGQIANTDTETIMDGGHRTRSINRFMNNDFSINILAQVLKDLFGIFVKQSSRSSHKSGWLWNSCKKI